MAVYETNIDFSFFEKKDLTKIRQLDLQVSSFEIGRITSEHTQWYSSVISAYEFFRKNSKKKVDINPFCEYAMIAPYLNLGLWQYSCNPIDNLYFACFLIYFYHNSSGRDYERLKKICSFFSQSNRFFAEWEKIWVDICNRNPDKRYEKTGEYTPFIFEYEKLWTLHRMIREVSFLDPHKIIPSILEQCKSMVESAESTLNDRDWDWGEDIKDRAREEKESAQTVIDLINSREFK